MCCHSLFPCKRPCVLPDDKKGKTQLFPAEQTPEGIQKGRVTGDGPGDLLIAPTWSQAKRTVLNELHHRMKEEHAYQGQLLDEEKGGNTP